MTSLPPLAVTYGLGSLPWRGPGRLWVLHVSLVTYTARSRCTRMPSRGCAHWAPGSPRSAGAPTRAHWLTSGVLVLAAVSDQPLVSLLGLDALHVDDLVGWALRTLSVLSSQFGLRTHVPPLAGSKVPSCMYGPWEKTSKRDLSALSLSLRTGSRPRGAAVAMLKSVHGFLK